VGPGQIRPGPIVATSLARPTHASRYRVAWPLPSQPARPEKVQPRQSGGPDRFAQSSVVVVVVVFQLSSWCLRAWQFRGHYPLLVSSAEEIFQFGLGKAATPENGRPRPLQSPFHSKSHRRASKKGEIDGDVLSPALRLRLRVLRLTVAGVPSPPSHGDHTPLVVSATHPSFLLGIYFMKANCVPGGRVRRAGGFWLRGYLPTATVGRVPVDCFYCGLVDTSIPE